MTSTLFTDYGGFDDLPYAEVTQEVVREVARSGNAVIVGRGGAFVLKDEPNTLHIHTFAPFPYRVRSIMRGEGLDQPAAERLVLETDRERARYIKNLFKAEWEAVNHYHLLLDCGRLGHDLAADLVVQAVNRLPAAE
jgi:cytidylate kinase